MKNPPLSNIVYLSLGANLGAREHTIRCAIQLLEQHIGFCLGCSSFFYSEPWGFKSEHPFCNICAKFCTYLSPDELLTTTQHIEQMLGRTHKGGAYRDRTIDIDILTYNDLHLTTPTLTLPHPLMHQRDFVRIPLGQLT